MADGKRPSLLDVVDYAINVRHNRLNELALEVTRLRELRAAIADQKQLGVEVLQGLLQALTALDWQAKTGDDPDKQRRST